MTISYDMGLGTPWYNSSGRILYVSDPRGTVYSFTYKGIGGTSVVRYLSQIKNNLSTGQTMTFAYSQPTQVVSPIGSGTAAETTVFLNSVTDTATGLITSFTYDPSGSGELTQVTYPYGGHIRWVYGNEMYASDRTVREVDARYLLWDTSIGERESVRNPGVRRP